MNIEDAFAIAKYLAEDFRDNQLLNHAEAIETLAAEVRRLAAELETVQANYTLCHATLGNYVVDNGELRAQF